MYWGDKRSHFAADALVPALILIITVLAQNNLSVAALDDDDDLQPPPRLVAGVRVGIR